MWNIDLNQIQKYYKKHVTLWVVIQERGKLKEGSEEDEYG
jgi:hypothetical protein